jgi:hypothetical protein
MDTLKDIMTTCVILHNMIIADVCTRVKPSRNPDNVQAFLETYQQIGSDKDAKPLQEDLVRQHWQRHGN